MNWGREVGYRTRQEGAGLLTSEALSKNKSLFLSRALFDKWAWSHLIPFLVFSLSISICPRSLCNVTITIYWNYTRPWCPQLRLDLLCQSGTCSEGHWWLCPGSTGEWWAAGAQSVLTVALCLLISSVGFLFVCLFFSGLEPFSLDPNIFQYNFSSIHCTPMPFIGFTYTLFCFCVLFSFNFSCSFSFLLFLFCSVCTSSHFFYLFFFPLMFSVALFSSHCIALISGIAASPLACS